MIPRGKIQRSRNRLGFWLDPAEFLRIFQGFVGIPRRIFRDPEIGEGF